MTRRFDERVVRVAAATLPRSVRATRREEWLADLEHAHELGIPRSHVTRAAVRSALTGRPAVSRRTRLAIGATVVAALSGLAPVVAVAAYTFDDLRGVVTTQTDADGREHTVHWRDYPGIAGLDAEEVLAGPSLEEGIALGDALVTEMRDAVTAEFGSTWAGSPREPVIVTAENHFGGMSLLRVVNARDWSADLSTPSASIDPHGVARILNEVAARFGFGATALETEPGSGVRFGMLEGPVGQWVSVSLEQSSLSIMYGANGLLAEADRAEFVERLEPFADYPQPEPQVS